VFLVCANKDSTPTTQKKEDEEGLFYPDNPFLFDVGPNPPNHCKTSEKEELINPEYNRFNDASQPLILKKLVVVLREIHVQFDTRRLSTTRKNC